jgi:transposase
MDGRLIRHDLTDAEWQGLLPMMPADARRGRRWSDEAEGADWTLSADSTVVRSHQHAAGARQALPAELATRGAIE